MPGPLDVEALKESAALLVGEHDFRAFTPTETRHEVFRRRVLRASWTIAASTSSSRSRPDSFLRHMVRTLVGTMVDLPPAQARAAARGRRAQRGGPTAPPWGLYLERVTYP